MNTPLSDPNLPAGAIIEEYEDGGALRNDGMTLRPANESLWYVLATLYGEQTKGTIDWGLHHQNTRAWNAWVHHYSSKPSRQFAPKFWGEYKYNDHGFYQQTKFDFKKVLAERGIDTAINEISDDVVFDRLSFENDFVIDGFDIPSFFIVQNCSFTKTFQARKARLARGISIENSNVQSTFNFDEVVAYDPLIFGKSKFFGDLSLKNAVLHASFDFVDSLAFRKISLDSTEYRGSVSFDRNRIVREASFEDCTFQSYAHFDETFFCHQVDFSRCEFRGETSFKRTRFLDRVPHFYDSKIAQSTEFSLNSSFWPNPEPWNANKGKNAYSRLRHVMNELQKPDDEHFFFRQEMHCKAVAENWPDDWVIMIYSTLSDFGHSVVRPMSWLAGTVGFGWGFMGSYLKNHTETAHPIAEGLGLSIANTFPFFGFIRRFHGDVYKDAPNWIEVIAGTQSVFGIILLFFLGLGLRNRFRLK